MANPIVHRPAQMRAVLLRASATPNAVELAAYIPRGVRIGAGLQGTAEVQIAGRERLARAIAILTAPQRTSVELSEFAQVTRDAQEQKHSPEWIAETIKQRIPALSALIDLLPRDRGELCSQLLILITVALYVQGASQAAQPRAPRKAAPAKRLTGGGTKNKKKAKF